MPPFPRLQATALLPLSKWTWSGGGAILFSSADDKTALKLGEVQRWENNGTGPYIKDVLKCETWNMVWILEYSVADFGSCTLSLGTWYGAYEILG